jgi:hypothetical protein
MLLAAEPGLAKAAASVTAARMSTANAANVTATTHATAAALGLADAADSTADADAACE